jgi:hypothetical protein
MESAVQALFAFLYSDLGLIRGLGLIILGIPQAIQTSKSPREGLESLREGSSHGDLGMSACIC